MYKKPKSLLGLDIGSHTIKAVEMTKTGEGYSITGYGMMPVDGEEYRRDAITDLVRTAGIKTKRTVSAVSGRSVIVRYVNMLQMSDEDLRGAIRFEADKYIPFDIDEVQLDCVRLEGAEAGAGMGGEMKVLLVAVKRTLIDEHVQMLDRCGLQPNIIDVDAFALGNAFELKSILSPRIEDEEKVIGLVDIGATKTDINIVKGSTSFFTREIYLAGGDFTEAIAKRLDFGLGEAEALKRDPGDSLEEVVDSVAPIIDDLANEIHLSFDYFENQYDREVEEVCLSGGGSCFPLLEETFGNIFEKKTYRWDPLENIDIQLDQASIDEMRANASQLAIAIGLASRLRKE